MNPKAQKPVLDPDAPAQASLSILAVQRPGSLFGSAPERASPPISLRSARRLRDLDVPRPFLGWVPFPWPVSLGGKPPSAKASTSSSGASCRLVRKSLRCVIAPKDSSASNFIPSPAGGDRSFCRLPHLPAVAGFPGRRG